jgi:hypothetical protein
MENYGMLKVVANYWKRVKSSHKGPYPEWPLEGDISIDDEQLDCEYVSRAQSSSEASATCMEVRRHGGAPHAFNRGRNAPKFEEGSNIIKSPELM